MTQMEPVVDCTKAKGLLSDLLDVRRGEQPAPMDSPLATPEVLSAVEKHVAGCKRCAQDLCELEELGLAFAESALEEPGEAHFAMYGRMVRERIRRMTQRTTARPDFRRASQWRTWLSTVAASAAAAVLTVVLINPTTSTPPVVPNEVAATDPTPPERNEMKGDGPVREDVKVAGIAAPGEVIRASEGALPDLPKFEPQSLSLRAWGEDGTRVLHLVPEPDKSYPDLSRFGKLALSESSKALVGIAFAADDSEVPEGLRVVAVKRGGVADAIGLRPEDRLLALNGITFTNSTTEEIVKFFNAVQSLGHGKLIQVDFARKQGDDWIIKRGRGELGKFE